MTTSFTRAGAALLLTVLGAVAAPSAAHATALCDQPVPPPACSEDPDPDPGPIDTPPRGALDSVAFTGNGARVTGWAADGDSAAPLQVHVYVDGAFAGAAVADTYRPDVAAVYPYFGAWRGYDAVVPARPGTHTVCTYAINVQPPNTSPAGNRQLGCRSYDVPAVANVASLYSGQWLVAFDDNVVGETGFEVMWEYFTWYTIPGTHERVATPRVWRYTLPPHEGTGRVTLPDQRPINATRLTVTAPGLGSASTTDLY
ncbi:hypothetical protein Daura_29050 [Dactylosporangium aurantiacum]|uniref:Uncharacterized protein n=1 Tax=Dactylosporangium aurantiacum TaxID=35754 RepID=A0A9Q9ICD3_9ACTN|nr:hypothetical protein [Dactylosporangium aurantiacum]MDG6106702.1 hypothetical protein [Dactylosporangium aurantiacum]UWZ50854.1 hypothetical protein Daura_29050 [Dactylosporangium aurantiacum]